MVAVSLLLVPVGHLGAIYAVGALVAGGWFVVEAHLLKARVAGGRPAKTMRLFHLSITYLTVLFLAVALDQLI
jgi:protoheme IX farnesyltransferase